MIDMIPPTKTVQGTTFNGKNCSNRIYITPKAKDNPNDIQIQL